MIWFFGIVVFILAIVHYVLSIEIRTWLYWTLFVIALWWVGRSLEQWLEKTERIERKVDEIHRKICGGVLDDWNDYDDEDFEEKT